VTKQFLDSFQRHPAHRQVRSEGVTKDVPADAAEAGLTAGAPERPLALAAVQETPVGS
jgi:hypothetical protein